jgi:hypothetical protein
MEHDCFHSQRLHLELVRVQYVSYAGHPNYRKDETQEDIFKSNSPLHSIDDDLPNKKNYQTADTGKKKTVADLLDID